MVDQKMIAGIFNDFLGVYIGKVNLGIRPLQEKYGKHPRRSCPSHSVCILMFLTV